MLAPRELEKSPLFRDISYEEYRKMLPCFQAAGHSYQPNELIYDFQTPPGTMWASSSGERRR